MLEYFFILAFIIFCSFNLLVISQNSSLIQLNQTNFTDPTEKVLFYGDQYKKNVTQCYLQTTRVNPIKSTSSWRLVWEDQFDDDSSLSSNMTFNWNVQNEITECAGNGLQPVTNCNLAKNVFQSHGLLVLMSKYEKYKDYNFTGSTVTTARHFNYGRFEIRAAQPIGDEIRTRIITRNTMESFWPENGQINIASNTMDSVLYRDVLGKSLYLPYNVDLRLYKSLDLHEFHVYGMEWSDKEVVFFFDQMFGAPIKFNESVGLRPLHQIQLQMGVGGRDFDGPVDLDHFEDLNWQCPAFLIDYIRVYEKVDEIPENSEICEYLFDTNSTTNSTTNSRGPSKEIVQQLCKIAHDRNIPPLLIRISKNLKYIILGVGIILVSFLVIYLIYLVIQKKRKMACDPFGLFDSFKGQPNPDGRLYEEVIYDIVHEHDPLKSTSYLNLYEELTKNESTYVPITGSIENILDDQQQYGEKDIYSVGNRPINEYVSIKRARSDSQVYQNCETGKDEKQNMKQEEEIEDGKLKVKDHIELIKTIKEDKYEPLCWVVGKFVPHKKESEKKKVTADNKNYQKNKYECKELKNYNKSKEIKDDQEPNKDDQISIKSTKEDNYEPLCRFAGKHVPNKKETLNNEDEEKEDYNYEKLGF